MNKLIKERTIKSFDKWSVTYSKDVEPKLRNRGHGYDILGKNILDFLQPEKEMAIMELGTGTGILGKSIKTHMPDVKILGLDISMGMLKEAMSTNVYESLIRCDAEHIPVKDNEYKRLYTAFMFHSLPRPKDALMNIRKLVGKGGRVVIVDLFRKDYRIPVVSMILDNLHSIKYEHGALSNYKTKNEFESIMKDCGMEVVLTKRLGERRDYTHYILCAIAI